MTDKVPSFERSNQMSRMLYSIADSTEFLSLYKAVASPHSLSFSIDTSSINEQFYSKTSLSEPKRDS